MLKGEWTTEEVRINKKTAATSNHLSIKKKIKRKHYIRELNCYVLILNCHQIICWLNLGFYESIILNKHFPHNINFNFWVDHTIKVKWRGGNRCWNIGSISLGRASVANAGLPVPSQEFGPCVSGKGTSLMVHKAPHEAGFTQQWQPLTPGSGRISFRFHD